MIHILNKSGPKNIKYVYAGETIQGVLDTCTDASASNLYEIIVPPGHETESWIGVPYITVLEKGYEVFTILAMGQSNMVGNDGTGEDKDTDNRVKIWDGSNWTVADLNNAPFVSGYNNIAFHFAKQFARDTDRQVRIILEAEGGRPITDWVPDTATHYVGMQTQITNSGTQKIDVVLWHHGEDHNTDWNSFYLENFRALVSQLREEDQMSLSTPIIVGELAVLSGKQNVILRNIDSYFPDSFVKCARATDLALKADRLHFLGNSLVQLGQERYYQVYKLGSVDAGVKTDSKDSLAFGMQILALCNDPKFLNTECEIPIVDYLLDSGFYQFTPEIHTTVIDSTSFQTLASGAYGIFKKDILIVGQKYTLTWATVQANVSVWTWDGSNAITQITTGSGTVTFTADSLGLFIESTVAQTVDISAFKVLSSQSDLSGAEHSGLYVGEWDKNHRIKRQGLWCLSPSQTSSYVDLGDHDDLSFGDGTTDSAFTLFGYLEVAALGEQGLITKNDKTSGSTVREYQCRLNTNKIQTYLIDQGQSAAAYAETPVLSVGWHTFVITYDGSGGAAAQNGISGMIDGQAVVMTPGSVGSYTAMGNLAQPVWIGASGLNTGLPGTFRKGGWGVTGIDKSEWTEGKAWRFHQACLAYYSDDNMAL